MTDPAAPSASDPASPKPPAPAPGPSATSPGKPLTLRRLSLITTVLAFTAGLSVANLYYVQPLLQLIGPDLGLSESQAATAVTVTQTGYAVGLLLLLPIGDLLENRGLMWITSIGTAISLLLTAIAPAYSVFLLASLLVGTTSVVAQLAIPFGASLVPAERIGRVVGTIMFGLLAGIMLSRAFSSLIAAAFGWRAMFAIASAAMLVLAGVLRATLPQRRPEAGLSYGQLMTSVWHIARTDAVVRRRGVLQAAVFGVFTVFWTTVPLHLAAHFGFGQAQIGLFALAGAAGAFAAPLAGRLADAGFDHPVSGGAITTALIALGLAWIGRDSIAALVVAAIVLDFAVQTHQVTSQHEVYSVSQAARSRLNAVFMTTMFLGGALSSLAVSLGYESWGWNGSLAFAAALLVAALAVWGWHAWALGTVWRESAAD